jgi:hypothetical protein
LQCSDDDAWSAKMQRIIGETRNVQEKFLSAEAARNAGTYDQYHTGRRHTADFKKLAYLGHAHPAVMRLASKNDALASVRATFDPLG